MQRFAWRKRLTKRYDAFSPCYRERLASTDHRPGLMDSTDRSVETRFLPDRLGVTRTCLVSALHPLLRSTLPRFALTNFSANA